MKTTYKYINDRWICVEKEHKTKKVRITNTVGYCGSKHQEIIITLSYGDVEKVESLIVDALEKDGYFVNKVPLV